MNVKRGLGKCFIFTFGGLINVKIHGMSQIDPIINWNLDWRITSNR